MSNSEKNKKVGRNDPCPCGSGKKFKKCHGKVAPPLFLKSDAKELEAKLEQIKAYQKQLEQQQGFGKSIVSTVFQGHRIVGVGGRLFHSPKWKTFPDFLFDYIKYLLGPDWGDAELKKSREERHPILNWYQDATIYMNSYVKEHGEVHDAPAIGAVSAYLGLAYDLYSLEHNAKIQSILLHRLKQKEQFYGAYYEVFMVGALLRAGFDIEFEDESDLTTTHCELTATYRKTGKKFSVEAKMRMPNKTSLDVGTQLHNALKKNANHTRLVFIEVNVPDDADSSRTVEVLGGVLKSIRTREGKLTIDGQPAPSAYVVVTNTPYHYSQNTPCKRCALVEGFKMPDFRFGEGYPDLRVALKQREKHREIIDLMKSMTEHSFPPATFDGEIPEFAFGASQSQPRLLIGKKYALPDGKDGETVGELQHAIVMENEKVAMGVYKMPDGKNALFTCPLSDDEVAAYRKFPDTFFGVDKPHTRSGIDDPLELYDCFFKCYKQTTKERLLKLMENYPDQEYLQSLPQEELASVYCERLVYGVFKNSGASKNTMNVLVEDIVKEASKPLVPKSNVKNEL